MTRKNNNQRGKVQPEKDLINNHRPIKKEDLDKIVEALFKVPPPPTKKRK
ncbi:MAG: hypothetical protein MRERV_17c003 [Mycoplasmataceae bacterium RV_VA103A]|nr:MAG: hypothetical protein MRERV_33c021 [Mycoplasmataceae bacterium RV_VA103A]KLL04569.1 MAG: hypothetical protein MRERV_17c003 [Mycoplasmataceae bacterium RV_VA103A]